MTLSESVYGILVQPDVLRAGTHAHIYYRLSSGPFVKYWLINSCFLCIKEACSVWVCSFPDIKVY